MPWLPNGFRGAGVERRSEYGFLKNDLSPKWTFRLTFAPLL